MQNEKTLRDELKRLPSLRRKAIKDNDLLDALEIEHTISTLEWVLSDE